MQGRGTFTYKNGDVYVGNWNDDERSGFGKIDYEDGSSYEGSWTNDERSGPGTYYFENGDRYVGSGAKTRHSPAGSTTPRKATDTRVISMECRGMARGRLSTPTGASTWATGPTTK